MGFMQLAYVGSGLHLLRVQGFEEGSWLCLRLEQGAGKPAEKDTGFSDAGTGQSGQLGVGITALPTERPASCPGHPSAVANHRHKRRAKGSPG